MSGIRKKKWTTEDTNVEIVLSRSDPELLENGVR